MKGMASSIKTRVLSVLDINADRKNIEEAAAVLKRGGLVAFPTETVYGLGANAFNPEAVSAIFKAKGRPADNPLITHVASPDEILPFVTEYPEAARKLAAAFWPGPLTIILPQNGKIPAITSAGLSTASFRVPSHPVARALIRFSGVPIAAPSANLSGAPSPTTAGHCMTDLTGRVEIILDGGRCDVGLESTVISLTSSIPKLLRPGAVTAEKLRAVLGEIEIDDAVTGKPDENRAPESPGMKYRHYAPKARLVLVHAESNGFIEFAKGVSGNGVFFLAFNEEAELIGGAAFPYGKSGNRDMQAHELFSALRQVDEAGAKIVYAHAPDKSGVGLAVYNRLLRAAGFNEIYI